MTITCLETKIHPIMSSEAIIESEARWSNTSSALADFRRSIQAEKDSERATKAEIVSKTMDDLQTTGQLLSKSCNAALAGTYSLFVGSAMGLASVKTAFSDEAAAQLIAGPLANLDKIGEGFRVAGVIGYSATSLVFLTLSVLTYRESLNNFRKVLLSK